MNKKIRKILSIILAFVMVVGLLPSNVANAEDTYEISIDNAIMGGNCSDLALKIGGEPMTIDSITIADSTTVPDTFESVTEYAVKAHINLGEEKNVVLKQGDNSLIDVENLSDYWGDPEYPTDYGCNRFYNGTNFSYYAYFKFLICNTGENFADFMDAIESVNSITLDADYFGSKSDCESNQNGIIINKELELDLNGHTINAEYNGLQSAIKVVENGVLTVKDSSTGGQIINGYRTIILENGGKLFLNSGTLKNTWGMYKGLETVSVNENSFFKMSGGAIDDSSSTMSAVDLYAASSCFVMDGGSIKNNAALSGVGGLGKFYVGGDSVIKNNQGQGLFSTGLANVNVSGSVYICNGDQITIGDWTGVVKAPTQNFDVGFSANPSDSSNAVVIQANDTNYLSIIKNDKSDSTFRYNATTKEIEALRKISSINLTSDGTITEGDTNPSMKFTTDHAKYESEENSTPVSWTLENGTAISSPLEKDAVCKKTINITPKDDYEFLGTITKSNIRVDKGTVQEITLNNSKSLSVIITCAAEKKPVSSSGSKSYKATDVKDTAEKISGSGKKGSTRTITPIEGKKVSSVVIKDKNGNIIDVKLNEDGTYSFTQPSSDVTVEVNYKNREITLNIGSTEADVDGERENLDVCPVIRNDRTMLPIRFVAENLGAKVEWSEKNPNYVVITRGDTKIEITLGSNIMKVNGMDTLLDSVAFAENDRTYLPVRAVSEALNAIVEWNEEKPMEVKIFER